MSDNSPNTSSHEAPTITLEQTAALKQVSPVETSLIQSLNSPRILHYTEDEKGVKYSLGKSELGVASDVVSDDHVLMTPVADGLFVVNNSPNGTYMQSTDGAEVKMDEISMQVPGRVMTLGKAANGENGPSVVITFLGHTSRDADNKVIVEQDPMYSILPSEISSSDIKDYKAWSAIPENERIALPYTYTPIYGWTKADRIFNDGLDSSGDDETQRKSTFMGYQLVENKQEKLPPADDQWADKLRAS